MNRHTKAVSPLALLSVFVSGCCQAGSPCENTSINNGVNTVAIVAGVAAAGAIGVGTAVAINHDRHILKGCVSSGPDGFQLTRDSDKKVFSLVGVSADIQPGEKVKLHGAKQKKQKGSPGNQQFLVERVTKDFGRCEESSPPSTPSTVPSR